MIIKYGKSLETAGIIANVSTFQLVDKVISGYIKELPYKSYYLISNLYDDFIRIDYGSYTDFFYIVDLPDNWRELYKGGRT